MYANVAVTKLQKQVCKNAGIQSEKVNIFTRHAACLLTGLTKTGIAFDIFLSKRPIMKRILYLAVAIILSANAFAQNLVPVAESSSVKFKIKNLGFNVGGSFTGLKGNIKFNPANTSASSIDVTVDANTVNTDNSSRDNHLRKEDYFNVEKYPHIRFVSEKITGNNGNYNITGKLTLKDVTRQITFPFTAKEEQGGYVFEGEFKIKRKDFHVGGGSTISDELTVMLHVVTKKE